jgi:iron(III) transport system ATP-binding protein
VITDEGEISCGILSDLTTGDMVVVVVRPESIVLHQKKPAHGDNVLEGKIGAAMFLGEYVDCTIELGKNVLETHQPHSLRVRRGDTVWVELPPGDCMALPAEQ